MKLPPVDNDLHVALWHAVDQARRRGHPEVTEAHVLYALLRQPAGRNYLETHGLSVAKLAAALEAETDRGVPPGYRAGAKEPEPSEELLEILESGGSGWFRRDALDSMAFVATLFAGARGASYRKLAAFELAPFNALVDRAKAIKKQRKADELLFAHATLALFEDPRFGEAIATTKRDPHDTYGLLEEYAGIAALPLPDKDDLVTTCAHHANATRRAELGLESFVATLLLDENAKEMVETMELDAYAVLYALFHRDVMGATDARSGRVDLVVHDDGFSAEPFVAELFERHLRIDTRAAWALVARFVNEGKVAVARDDAARAASLLQKMRASAKQAAVPLRMALVAT